MAEQEKIALESSAIAEEATKAAESDSASLAATTADCQTNVKDYAQRSEDRSNEQIAVQTAIDYLDSDEARDLFRETAATFFQVDQNSEQTRREKARQVLQAAGLKNHNTKMLVLAQTVLRGGVFDKIITAINELEKELNDTKASDQKEFDSCTGSINEKKQKITNLKSEITSETEQETNAKDAIQRLTDEIAAKTEEIDTLSTEMKDSGFLREQASGKFTVDYANNEAAVKLLDKAIVALQDAYPHSLLEEAVVQAPGVANTMEQPADFKEYKKNSSGNSVVTALEKIKNDINKSMEDAIAQETAENEAYANTVSTLTAQITGCRDQKTQFKSELVEEERTLQSVLESLEAHTNELKNEEDSLKSKQKTCKFIMENLDIRKTHMDSEIKALQQAREFLKDMTTKQGA
jgi:chromosome segregation ATPase